MKTSSLPPLDRALLASSSGFRNVQRPMLIVENIDKLLHRRDWLNRQSSSGDMFSNEMVLNVDLLRPHALNVFAIPMHPLLSSNSETSSISICPRFARIPVCQIASMAAALKPHLIMWPQLSAFYWTTERCSHYQLAIGSVGGITDTASFLFTTASFDPLR